MSITASTDRLNQELLLKALSHQGPEAAIGALDTHYSAGFIRHGDKSDYTRDQLREGLARLYRGFPDLVRTHSDVMVQGRPRRLPVGGARHPPGRLPGGAGGPKASGLPRHRDVPKFKPTAGSWRRMGLVEQGQPAPRPGHHPAGTGDAR